MKIKEWNKESAQISELESTKSSSSLLQSTCVQCHGMLEGMSPYHNEIGCVACHFGNNESSLKDSSHMGMISIPGNFSDADQTCGLCHVQALADIKNEYDFVIIDCAPSLGLLTLNALTAADAVIIPIQCEYFALEGLGKLLNTIKSVQKIHNPELDIEGLLLTMYDSRLRLSNQVVEEVQKHFNNMVFQTIIQRNVRLSEAPSYGENIIKYDASSKGATNYLSLAKEIINKNS